MEEEIENKEELKEELDNENDKEQNNDENQNEETIEQPASKSILTSIKKLLGIAKDCTDFDDDIIMHINTVFMILNQLGVGTDNVFAIEDSSNTWDEFLNQGDDFNAVKSYIHLKVRLLFDPPLSTAVQEAIQQSINELEWRLNTQAEYM